MSDSEYSKLAHEAKDAKDIADIDRYINELEYLVQRGRWYDVNQLICEISEEYKTEADSYNEGRVPAQTPQDAAPACYQFLVGLRNKKIAKKAAEKLAEEALKHQGGT